MITLFHVSPIEDRNSIKRHGLIALEEAQAGSPFDQPVEEPRPALYFFPSKDEAMDYAEAMAPFYPDPGVDIWKVDLDEDSLKNDRHTNGLYSTEDVLKDKIKHVTQVLADNKNNPEEFKQSNILDPVHNTLDQDVFNGTTPKSVFFDYHLDHVREVFRQNGFNRHAFDFYLTGSLCTYQYSETSDVDISIVCNLEYFSEEDRSELISIVVNSLDGTFFPRTLHRYQHFVQPFGIDIYDLFSLGTRAAWDFQKDEWVIKPDRNKVYDISKEKPDWISTGIQTSDKINALIEAGKDEEAKKMYKLVHSRRKEDQQIYGDYSEGNIIYKFLDNNGTFERLRNIGQRIA